MEAIRFERFIYLIEGIHKSIGRIKFDTVPDLGIKSVHVMWLYKLLRHPDGLTASELAAASTVDPSLVSREITALKKSGYIEAEGGAGKRAYNARLRLTPAGREIAERIREEAVRVQQEVSREVGECELEAFYTTLEAIHSGFSRLTESDIN